jgi:hypothetical protein
MALKKEYGNMWRNGGGISETGFSLPLITPNGLGGEFFEGEEVCSLPSLLLLFSEKDAECLGS